jgi:colanic acid biosynthesis glycosyl transferase WcaI
MKIALHEMGTYATAQRLAQALASRGHEIIYVYSPSLQTPSLSSMCFTPDDGVTVVPVALESQLAKRNLFKRYAQQRAYGARISSVIDELRPDLVISANTPIDVQHAIEKMCRRSGRPFVLWLQDIYSIALRSVVPVVGNLLAARYALLERNVARSSKGIVANSDDFRQLLIDWGIASDRIVVIENWGVMPPGPMPTKNNDWAIRHHLDGKRVLLYSGALGFKHNPQLFLDLAREFQHEEDVRVAVISEGYGADWLLQRQEEFPGLVLLPFQPMADYYKALAAADVLVAILEPDAAKYSVPGKVLTYMTVGRPILAAMPAANLAARTVRSAAAGVTVDPEDRIELCRLARALIDDESRRRRLGEAALAHAQANFNIDTIAQRFEEVFHRFAAK